MNHLEEIHRIIKVYTTVVKFKLLFWFLIIIIENMVLRSLVGDPNRHTPSGEHTSPSMISSEGKPLSSMYTLETRYQPIPARVLPKKTEKTKIYYMESKPIEESPNEEIPSPIQSVSSTSFLEPKVLSQPILYSVPGAKPKRPILIHEEPSTPTVYAITGRPRRPTIDLSVNDSEIIDQSPALYALVGTPRVQNQIPEPSKQYLQPTANLYSLVGSPRAQDQIPESPKPFPNLYSVVGSPARTSRGVQVSPLGPARPAPTVYTTVNDTSASINKPKENRLPPNKKQPTDEPVYNSDSEGKVRYEQQLVQKPTTYALVDQPNPSVQENRTKYSISFYISKIIYLFFIILGYLQGKRHHHPQQLLLVDVTVIVSNENQK
jgi:hypothetical protein